MSKVYLSLGSNMGDSFFYILNALCKIDKLTNTKITKVSNFYKTKAWGLTEQDDFLNCCVEIDTYLLPYKLLSEIHIIEQSLHRIRSIHWGPRTIDIDIIFYDNLQINTEKLHIPHKYYKQRSFVLIPLLDIIKNKNLILPYINKKDKSLQPYNYNKKIGISACLLGDNVKYNGGNNLSKLFTEKISLDYIKICPETFGGLSIPRVPSEIINNHVFSKNGENLDSQFLEGARKTFEKLRKNNVDIVIMKSKSPSCGHKLIYDGTFSNKLIIANGITTDYLLQNGLKIISY